MNFWQHRKNCVAITTQKNIEHSIENEAAVACSYALRGTQTYSFFFTTENKSAVEIHREVCSRHCRIICIDIQLLYTKHTSLLGFKPIPECAALDSRVSDQGRICDFIY